MNNEHCSGVIKLIMSSSSSSPSEQENSYTFRSADLPLISLPSLYSSSRNSSESDTAPLFTPSNTLAFTIPGPQIDSATELSTSIEPPTESPSSPTELGSTFSRVELYSQTSADNADLSSSNASGVGKRRIHKTNTGRFQKGVGIKRKTSVIPTTRKRSSFSKPKSVLFQKAKFPRPNQCFGIKVRKEDTVSYAQAPLSRLVQSSDKVCQLSMSLAANRVLASAETSHIPNVRNCTVSFDATWHQRGYYPNQGFAAAIEVGSGKVLDYALYDRNCNKCIKWSEERKEKNPDEFSHYWGSHSSQCPGNFKGTSQAMESSAALEIWNRSVEKHSLAYTTYVGVGDGDSKSFKRLCDNDPYNGK